MKDFKIDKLFLFRAILIIGIVFLAYYDKEGWGWLVFALLLTL